MDVKSLVFLKGTSPRTDSTHLAELDLLLVLRLTAHFLAARKFLGLLLLIVFFLEGRWLHIFIQFVKCYISIFLHLSLLSPAAIPLSLKC